MYFIDGVAVGSIHHEQLEAAEQVAQQTAEDKPPATKRGATVTSQDVSA
jgi:hypothetical protein